MTGSTNRRGFLRTIGAGTAGLAGAAIGLGSSTAFHVAGLATADAAGHPDEPAAADIGFCTDMTVHHVQALAMCQRVLGRDTGDPVQAAAAEVLQTQAIEVGMMRAWLADWGQSTATPETAMAWMGANDGADMPTAMMPGLASDEEMREFATASGMAQGRRWLELMRAHHVGGVAMANAAVEVVTADKVRRIAETQVAVQTYEISQYDLLLSTDYSEVT